MCLNDFMMSNAVAFDKKAGKFQEKDEEEGGHVLFFSPELIGANDKAPNNSHDAAYQYEETEELEKEVKERADRTRLKHAGKREEWNAMAQFYKITRGKPFDHIHNKGGHESKYQ